MLAGFEAAKQDTLKAFENLKSSYADCCHELATFAAHLDEMDIISQQVGDPNLARIRESVLVQTLNPPNPTLLFQLIRAGYGQKSGGWGPNWRIQIMPLFRPQKGNS